MADDYHNHIDDHGSLVRPTGLVNRLTSGYAW